MYPLTESILLPVSPAGLVVLLTAAPRRKHSLYWLLGHALFWLYLLNLAGLTLFPIPIPSTMESRSPAVAILSRVKLIPFDFGGLFDLHPNVIHRELGGNILLTIPFGLGLPFLSRIRARAILWLAIMVGLTIETAQLMISLAIGGAYRGVDINDVLLNAAVVFIGYGIFSAFTCLITLQEVNTNRF